MIKNTPNRSKILLLVIQCTISIRRHSKIHPNMDFWYENIPYGNPGWQSGQLFWKNRPKCSPKSGHYARDLRPSSHEFKKQIFWVYFLHLIHYKADNYNIKKLQVYNRIAIHLSPKNLKHCGIRTYDLLFPSWRQFHWASPPGNTRQLM
jgi:hypothetical protein